MTMNDAALKTLKSFANINSGMVFKPGTKLEVFHELKMVMGYYETGVNIPEKFAIYDLHRFLGVVGFHDKDTVEYDIDGNVMVIKSKKGRTNYRLTDPTNVVTSPPSHVLTVDNKIGSFVLKSSDFDEIKSISNSLTLPHIIFKNNDGKLAISVKDTKNDSCDDHVINSDAPASGEFDNLVFKIEYLGMLMPGHDYTVDTNRIFANFVSEDKKLEYFIVMEK